MKLVTVALLAASLYAAEKSKSYTGVITDDMCGADHKVMGVSPDLKCIHDCIKDMKAKYVLAVGNNVYVLSDQKTPEKFAGKKVRIEGTLDAKSKTLNVKSMAAAQ